MESWVDFGSPQNIFWASQQNSVAAFSLTTGIAETLKHEEKTENKT